MNRDDASWRTHARRGGGEGRAERLEVGKRDTDGERQREREIS